MNAKSRLAGWTCRSLIVAVIFLTALGVWAIAPTSDEADEPRVDIISIDGLKAFGELERQPVVYLHQKHTEALAAALCARSLLAADAESLKVLAERNVEAAMRDGVILRSTRFGTII